MIRNYLMVAVRAFLSRKLYSFINVSGLAVALTTVILIGLYAQEELSFDADLPGQENIYRVALSFHIPGQTPEHTGAASPPLGPAMQREIGGIAEQSRMRQESAGLRIKDKTRMVRLNKVDGNFFTLLHLPFAEGNPVTALARPDGLVLTEQKATDLFGTKNAIGKTLRITGDGPRTVTGILKNLPYNTQIDGSIFVRYPPLRANATVSSDDPGKWTQMDVSSYVRLEPGGKPEAIAAQIPPLMIRHLPRAFLSKIAALLHSPGDKTAAQKMLSAKLVPLRDVHLTEYMHGGGIKPAGSRVQVYGFIAIAFLVLMIAGSNFTNLTTACATMRAREVALRKALGARCTQIIAQFLLESVLTALISLYLAIVLTELLLPAFNGFLGHKIYMDDTGLLLPGLLGITIVTGLIGGIYPALVLSGFRPGLLLHSRGAATTGTGRLRRALVVFQFAISIGLGIAALVVFSQIRYAQNMDLGFDRDNVLSLRVDYAGLDGGAQERMRRSLVALPGVTSAALSDMVPGDSNGPLNVAQIPETRQKISVMTYSVSPEFARTYGLKLIAGRFLSRDRGRDVHQGNQMHGDRNIVIDEAAARAFGYSPQEAIGKKVTLIGGTMTIVGVVHKVLFHGAEAEQVAPTVYYDNPDMGRHISVRLKGGRIPQTITAIDRIWQHYIPDRPVDRHFIDAEMNALYADAQRQGRMMAAFVGIAIIIACMGQFGLAAFTAERRKKEISIRKVFGATKGQIIRLLLWRFSVPVLTANLFAWPVAYLWLSHWLSGYARHIPLSPHYFLAAGLAALVIAALTVSVNAWQSASVPPAHALRSE